MLTAAQNATTGTLNPAWMTGYQTDLNEAQADLATGLTTLLMLAAHLPPGPMHASIEWAIERLQALNDAHFERLGNYDIPDLDMSDESETADD